MGRRPGWGSVARRGAHLVGSDEPPSPEARRRLRDRGSPPQHDEGDRWVEDVSAPPARREPAGRRRPAARRAIYQALSRDIGAAVGPRQARRVEDRVAEAAAALDADRPRDALRLLRPVLGPAADVAVVRELAGLAFYRLGKWAEAVEHLEGFRRLTSSTEQHPVLADAYRALGRYAAVDELWEELRSVSPAAPLVSEGRIVAAGALADQGKLPQAITLLERGVPKPGRPVGEHQLRLLYALADLHERVGDAPRARELFARVAQADPSLADTAERLQALS